MKDESIPGGLVPREEHGGALRAPVEPTLEEMRENLLYAIRVSLKGASGIRDEEEFKLMFWKTEHELIKMLDHVIILAMEHGK